MTVASEEIIANLAGKLIALEDGEFRLVCDDECRRRIDDSTRVVDRLIPRPPIRRGQPDPRVALIASALIHETVVERYNLELVAMKKSIEQQIAARKAEVRAKRIDPDIDDIEARYLKWRAGVLRLLTAIEERLSATRIIASKFGVAQRAQALREDRDVLGGRANVLIAAIRRHRNAVMENKDVDADEELWSWIGEG